ncbi:hypothetical protein [Dictyobacter vulcani]|uniref:hypothetical protein n=1 Tax=Dictyobacter vulcani TaxID=2607529 RepID=UPI0012502AAA|nr:hypothetical protein [Dictyobacter vulcani]
MLSSKHQWTIKRAWIVFLCLIIALIFLSLWFLRQQSPPSIPVDLYKSHIVGGFGINTSERAMRATTEGIQVIFQYGNPPDEKSTLGRELQSLHMKVVDGYIASYLHYYECQRLSTMVLPLRGPNTYCGQNLYPTFASEDAFLTTIATHLQQVKDNHLIIGYWTLDDWPRWDKGSGRQLLIKIHHLIKLYTPDHPAICGFGGNLTANRTFAWEDWIADNFSPQGCDEVGLYIYTLSIPMTSHLPSSEAYDWSMSKLLPAIFSSLHHRGWKITKEPFIGIVQAFGGPIAHTYAYRVAPTAKDIETQSRSFCEHKAIGLTFYGWADTVFVSTSQTPMNSNEIALGIQRGIAACIQYWNHHAGTGK